MNNLSMNILGFPAVNKDIDVEIRDVLTNAVVQQRKPFLDGTVTFPRMRPGSYEVVLKHPNLALPVARRPIRVLPKGPTKITMIIDPSQFRDTPIADIPDADLSPVRQVTEGVAALMAQLGEKEAGELIKAEDWNALVDNLRQTAEAVTELTRLVAPTGHNHPELEDKFDEVTGNFRSALEILNTAMVELQRQIQTLSFRKTVDDVLDSAGIDRESTQAKPWRDIVDRLEKEASKSPTQFSRVSRTAGVELATQIEKVLQDKPDLVDAKSVAEASAYSDLLRTTKATSYAAELAEQQKRDRTLGGTTVKAFKGV
ncbi:hypothetical protein [Sedimentitalea arenosa]|jgi:hypothetical protein|uniref:Uncharacterized protein n=1 Tax=Sedimentitalea arenosa TaxID=2798803 RepID=A0A8J7J797_9RHOB|nr:hypothetical protein [Arenibacterium arenosum]MBJ6369929.1 hypothetical protein [Arenibacterium arenosum]